MARPALMTNDDCGGARFSGRFRFVFGGLHNAHAVGMVRKNQVEGNQKTAFVCVLVIPEGCLTIARRFRACCPNRRAILKCSSKPSHKCPRGRLSENHIGSSGRPRGSNNSSERRIFCPPASLFVGHSPTSGMVLPDWHHSSRLAGNPNLSPRHPLPFMR
jgi:hypothetical protein